MFVLSAKGVKRKGSYPTLSFKKGRHVKMSTSCGLKEMVSGEKGDVKCVLSRGNSVL